MKHADRPSQPLGRSCLSALMAALLVNTACTAPRGGTPPHGPRSAPPQTAHIVVDEGPVRLESLGDDQWRLVVLKPPLHPPSPDFTRAEALTLLDELHAGERNSSLLRADIAPAGFFGDGSPPGTPPPWAYRLHSDLAARHATSLLPRVHELPGSRFRLALQFSVAYMPAGIADAAISLFTDPAFYAGLLTGLVVYVTSWLLPEPFFSKGAAIALTWALILAFGANEIRLAAGALMALYQASKSAESADALETAAEQFGRAASGSVVRILAMIATRYAARALPKVPPGGFRSLAFRPWPPRREP